MLSRYNKTKPYKFSASIQNNNGFTLIELMIVVAIIGILASFAIQQYSNYVGRAQVADAVQIVRTARIIIDENLNRGERFPDTADLGDYGVSTTSSSLVVNLVSDPATNQLSAQFREENVTYLLENKKLVWSYQAQGGWKCNKVETDIPQNLTPADCK